MSLRAPARSEYQVKGGRGESAHTNNHDKVKVNRSAQDIQQTQYVSTTCNDSVQSQSHNKPSITTIPRQHLSKHASALRNSDTLLSDLRVLLIHNITLLNIPLHLLHINMCNGIIAVEDPANLLKCRSPGLRVDKVDPDKLDADPAL